MTRRPAYLLLLLLLALVLPALAPATDHISRDPQVAQARALVDAGRFEEALPILRRSLASAPPATIDDVRFLIGLAATGAGERAADEKAKQALFAEAIAAYHAMLVARPGLVRVRLELARAFFLKGDDDLARAHFERVLASGPAPAVAANIRVFLAQIDGRRRLSGYLSVAMAQDSNITSTNAGPTVVYIFGLPFTLDEEREQHSGYGVAISGGGEYQHPLARDWRWRLGADFKRTEYAGGEFDSTELALHTGPRWLVGPGTELSALLTGGQRWAGGRRDHRRYGLRLEYSKKLSQRLGLQASAAYERRRYRRNPDADGHSKRLFAGASYLLTPLWSVRAGAGVARVKANQAVHGNRDLQLNAGTNVLFAGGWTLGGDLNWLRRRHEGFSPLANDGRGGWQQDFRRVLSARLHNRGWTVMGFSPQLGFVHEDQSSNAAPSRYSKNWYELKFVRQL